jgi:excisionase family DNA binding protein
VKIENPLPQLDVLQRYSLKESCRYLRVSAPTLYAYINAGRLKSIKQGKRRFISGAEIARLSQ